MDIDHEGKKATLTFKEAEEPTNYLWENRMAVPNGSIPRIIFFVISVTILFALTFAATFYLHSFI